ncbi:hypothetical protein RhiirC2_796066 [Rhizophagus irregularis]|uniref:Uncharacterized protein n=1 Tax=Rhizophagus irregularis TaxID=588596 RepID=A0A2N1MAB3_9GLOM|nr:hypothetical protein RhiirC2_796066 [Rhizophagus irregularis]
MDSNYSNTQFFSSNNNLSFQMNTEQAAADSRMNMDVQSGQISVNSIVQDNFPILPYRIDNKF